MKIETDENTAQAFTFCFIALAIAAMSIGGCYQVESTRRAAFNAGLKEVQAVGSTTTFLGK